MDIEFVGSDKSCCEMLQNKTFIVEHNGEKLIVCAKIRKKDQEWIFCLHGIQSNKNLFNELLSQSFFENYSLLSLDFIGFGESDKPENFSYNLVDQAAICESIIDQLNVQKLHIIGHSLGGMVGTLLLESIGEKIISFVNLEGNLILEDCGASKEMTKLSFEEFRKKGYDELKEKVKSSNEKSKKIRVQGLSLIPSYAFYKTSQSIVSWSESRKLLDIFLKSSMRKLFVFGDKNKQKSEALNGKIPLAKISNAGHFMILDNFEETFEKIRTFLESF